MKLCFGQSTVCETATTSAFEAAVRGGFERIELWWPKLQSILEEKQAREIAGIARDQGLEMSAVSGVGLELVGSQELWSESISRFETVVESASSLGIPLVNFTPGLTHEVVDEGTYAKAASRLAELVGRLDSNGPSLALEFRSDSRWLTSLPTAAALVLSVGTDRLGLCLDIFHYYCGPSKPDDLTPDVIGLIRCVQWSDIVGTPRETARDYDRILPGEGDFDLTSLMAILAATHYDGLHTVEAPNPSIWPIAADRVADMAYQALFRVCHPEHIDS